MPALRSGQHSPTLHATCLRQPGVALLHDLLLLLQPRLSQRRAAGRCLQQQGNPAGRRRGRGQARGFDNPRHECSNATTNREQSSVAGDCRAAPTCASCSFASSCELVWVSAAERSAAAASRVCSSLISDCFSCRQQVAGEWQGMVTATPLAATLGVGPPARQRHRQSVPKGDRRASSSLSCRYTGRGTHAPAAACPARPCPPAGWSSPCFCAPARHPWPSAPSAPCCAPAARW